MLQSNWHHVRLFLHVLAATVWVGGQLTLAGLVPGLRARYPDAPRAVARRFNQFAWPAFGVLVATGVWNILAVKPGFSGAYAITLFVKLIVVGLSGTSALLHTVSRSKLGLAVWGALGGASAVGALYLGVLLHG